ncbi:hypothetical protein [Candidatus Thiodiazotropha sp. CDECU1]|uniref:hypothetical protein n=1 Tax=Candidatus Thiodiazotropha sp. CDECU1 TaxID=3065865 RepID=UPI00292EFBA6|nr:hypothetical protein [Candidatus Thiodiazotropha sp. CDECU1]
MLVENATITFDAPHPAAVWAEAISLDPLQVDCVTTIMLTILDNQCEMGLEEQIALMAIYSVVKHRDGVVLEKAVHQAIERAQVSYDQQITDEIHELRLHAERAIPRQIMRYFKRFLHDSLYGF